MNFRCLSTAISTVEFLSYFIKFGLSCVLISWLNLKIFWPRKILLTVLKIRWVWSCDEKAIQWIAALMNCRFNELLLWWIAALMNCRFDELPLQWIAASPMFCQYLQFCSILLPNNVTGQYYTYLGYLWIEMILFMCIGKVEKFGISTKIL